MDKYLELLVTLGFLAALMWGMMKFMLRDIHRDLADIRNDVAGLRKDIGKDIGELKQAQQRTDSRIDHLYEENNRLYHILIDLVQKK